MAATAAAAVAQQCSSCGWLATHLPCLHTESVNAISSKLAQTAADQIKSYIRDDLSLWKILYFVDIPGFTNSVKINIQSNIFVFHSVHLVILCGLLVSHNFLSFLFQFIRHYSSTKIYHGMTTW